VKIIENGNKNRETKFEREIEVNRVNKCRQEKIVMKGSKKN
jgi:hypothetical protein